MPYDKVLVRMSVDAIYRCGLDLSFDYYLMENDRIARKLAHGKHKMAWVGRNSASNPMILDLSRNVIEALLKALNQCEGPTQRGRHTRDRFS
jgi:hypothetical protein